MTDTKLDFIQWNYINYGMSADFLEYYAEKHPEPPENPFHSDLATILESLRLGEKLCLEMRKHLKNEPIAEDYQI